MAELYINASLFTAAADAGYDVIERGVLAVTDEGTIAYAGRGDTVPAEFIETSPVDLAGRFMMPGLIDCHVHLCHDGVVDLVTEADDTPFFATVKAVANAERALLAGVTSVRDLGARDHMVLGVGEAITKGVIGGPRIVAAGRLLTMTGGHGHFLGREVDGADDMRRAVREEIKAGAGVIKTVATGGVLTPRVTAQQSAYSQGELEAAVETAHAAGVPVTAHAIGNAGIKVALRAGVDSIEHGCFLDDEAIELMLAGGVTLVATLSAPAGILRGRDQGVPDYAVSKSEEVFEAHKASFRRAVEAGVRIACGTDAGTPLNPHGSTAGEVALMVDNGLSPEAALIAATRTSAELLRVDAVTGTLEAGKAADVLVVDGDPRRDIAVLRQPAMVLARGQQIRP